MIKASTVLPIFSTEPVNGSRTWVREEPDALKRNPGAIESKDSQNNLSVDLCLGWAPGSDNPVWPLLLRAHERGQDDGPITVATVDDH